MKSCTLHGYIQGTGSHDLNNLIDLDGREDLLAEPQSRHEPDCACHKEDANANDRHVSKIQEVSDDEIRFELDEVNSRVKENVNGCRTRREERPPPPRVVLST